MAMIRKIAEYQRRVGNWMRICFSNNEMHDGERALRFLEEAIELSQAMGISREETERVMKYVYSRPVGVKEQEVGGVMVTLACLCGTAKISMLDEGNREFNRVNTPEMMEKLRAKQAFKRTHGITLDNPTN